MKVAINKDDWHGVYFLHTEPVHLQFLPNFEIDDQLYLRYLTASLAFNEVQEELKSIYEAVA